MITYFCSASGGLGGLGGQAEVLALPGGAAQLFRQRGRLPVGVVQPGGQLGPLVADLAQLALQQARLAPQVARAPRQLVVVALELPNWNGSLELFQQLKHYKYIFTSSLSVL